MIKIFSPLQIEFSPYHGNLENTWVTGLYNSLAFSFHQNQSILDHFVLNACTAPLCILVCFKLTYFFKPVALSLFHGHKKQFSFLLNPTKKMLVLFSYETALTYAEGSSGVHINVAYSSAGISLVKIFVLSRLS